MKMASVRSCEAINALFKYVKEIKKKKLKDFCLMLNY